MGSFVIKTIDMTLNPESIQHAINIVNELRSDLPKALDALCEYLLKQGVFIAKMKLLGYTSRQGASARGDLYRSIRYEIEDGKGYLLAGYPNDHGSDNPAWANISYAVFFEFGFGTSSNYDRGGRLLKSESSVDKHMEHGLIGKRTGRTKNHPTDRDVYRRMEDYSVRKDSEDSPEYFGWVYKNKKDGKFYVSRGQNPKPFMYETLLALTEKAEQDGGRIIGTYFAENTI